MITPAEFKVRFPEFATEDDARIQLFIGDSVLVLNETYWDEKYDLGLYYLTAHYLTLGNQTGDGDSTTGKTGPVQARAVDGASVSYGSGAIPKDQSEGYYLQTSYGQRYLALVKSLGIAAFVV